MSQNLPSRHPFDADVPSELQASAEMGQVAPFGRFADEEEESGPNLQRYVGALFRYKWLIMAMVLLGSGVGVFLARRVKPMYVAQATIWIEDTGDRATERGPVQQAGLLESSAWVDLLKSYVVLDHVVRSENLYLEYEAPADSQLFRGFTLQERFRPGPYQLELSEDRRSYELKADRGWLVESGVVGDSVGRAVGFSWQPTAEALRAHESVEFVVRTPRDAALALRDNMQATLPVRFGSFMRLELEGENAARIASTLNATAERFVDVAADLKRSNSEELTAILEEQAARTARALAEAEIELEAFRVETITLPSENSSAVSPGIEATRDPAFESFFALRLENEQLSRDRNAIERALEAQEASGATPGERLWPIESVQNSADLRQALEELTAKQAELRTLRTRFTEQHADVQRLTAEVRTLEREAVPSLARTLVAQIDARQQVLERLIAEASAELERIPPRMIEEARLERRVASAEAIHLNVQSRYEAARLAAVSSIPDVRILDEAAVPHRPTNPTARQEMVLMAFLASLGLGVGGAVLGDRFDKRVRYPTQVTGEMGLPILGAIQLAPPDAPAGSEASDQVIEAFRELRLGVKHAYGSAGPVMLTITSPGSGDGKSFVSSNLALAFADLGYKTLIIDGDIRRGTLHNVLGGRRKPGLTDYLAGQLPESSLIQETQYPNVSFIGAGAWRRSGPELLVSPAMRSLLAEMRSRYQVIIVDSSPLGAGVDPFVLGTVTGNLLMVLRTGATDRELAGAKLDVLQRLPIRILGAVLNAVPARGAYRYYAYLSSYQLPPGETEPAGAEV